MDHCQGHIYLRHMVPLGWVWRSAISLAQELLPYNPHLIQKLQKLTVVTLFSHKNAENPTSQAHCPVPYQESTTI